MKQKITNLWQMMTRSSRLEVVVFSIGCGVLGLLVLSISLEIFLVYEQSGKSSIESAEVVPMLRTIIRWLSFGILPMLAMVLLLVPVAFRSFARACRSDAAAAR